VFQDLLKRVAGELSRNAIPYMVIGGQAVLLYGEPRLTKDIDIHKIVAGRPRDIDDIKIMLLKNPSYDKVYIRRWLADFDASLEEGFLAKFNALIKTLRTGS
jgi:hypothetical protein